MGAQAVVAVLGTIFGIVGVLGIAYAVFRSATVQKTLDLYRSENEALGRALARQQADLLTLTTKAEELEKANAVLQRTVSGREAVESLARQANEWQRARQAEHVAMMDLLAEMKDQMSDLWRGVVRVLGDG